MGDVLPPKQQTLERLKTRLELYRRRHNACLPRYEQAESALYEIQRQDTLALKQRVSDSKAKKAKSNKSDHHRSYKESVTDNGKTQVHAKAVKRPAEDPIPNPSAECASNEEVEKKASKILRSDITSEKLPDLQKQQPSLPNFSVQLVQQFTNTSHSQQSQTIQTSITVQALKKPLSSTIPQSSSKITSQEAVPSSNDIHQSNNATSVANIECKQEKDCSQMDLCQFKSAQNSTSDRLSDTFPSIGFTDDSGDDVFNPELLKDLFDDVFTNSPMNDFNFDDSVGSIKDQEEATKDIISNLIKDSSPIPMRPFQTDNLSFVNSSVSQQQTQQHHLQPQQQQTQQHHPPPQQQQLPQQQQQQQQQTPSQQQQPNGLFKSISNNEVPITALVTSTTPTTSTATFYTTPTQRLPSYGSASLNIPNGLGLDFKLTEPSPAALTLKQMAEQHQNMQQKQQQQLGNPPHTNRPFNQDAFSPHMNPLRSTTNYLPATNTGLPNNNTKTQNSNNMFIAFDRSMTMNNFNNNEPLNNLSISPNSIFDADIHSRTSNAIPEADHSKQSNYIPVQQQQSQQQQQQQQQHQLQQQQKPPSYSAVRPLTHFSENAQVRLQNPVGNQHQRPVGRQFQNSVRMPQASQMHPNQGHHNAQQLQQNSLDLNQQQHQQQQHHMMHQSHSNNFTNFPSQQPINNNSTFHAPASQTISYSTQFTSLQTMNRPPPEYKPHQPNLSIDNVNLVDQVNTTHAMFSQTNSNKEKFAKSQRPPNVTITADGSVIRPSSSMDWRHMMNEQQNRMTTFRTNNNYNFVRNEHPVQQPQIFNQYRMPNNQMPANRMIRPNMVPNHMLMQQRQRVSTPQRARNPAIIEQNSSMGIVNNMLPVMSSGYSSHQDMSRADGSQINLDFLDNIESSASDLLNFDQVMQSGGAHFPLLDEIEILGK